MAMAADGEDAQPWLLLIHQIPPKPDYLRVKIGRRLARVGAVAIKNSVYVLPATEQAVEDFQWIRREIADGGGDASICRSIFVDGLTDGEIRRLFHEARASDYEELAEDARALLASIPSRGRLTTEQRAAAEDALGKIRNRIAAVSRIDFFGTRHHGGVGEILDAVEVRLRPPPAQATAGPVSADREEAHGRTWVTRQGIFVDRIASAWLIRRFIDPEARFKFLAPPQQRSYRPRPGELRFDMYDAEYTHEGDHCTFETLLRRFGIEDPVLADIAEIVHDIDLKDEKFGRQDALGIERVLAGIAAIHAADAARLERGTQLFNELYALRARELGVASAAADRERAAAPRRVSRK